MVADEGEGRSAEGWLGDGIEVIEIPIDDSWIRDNGPMFVTDGQEPASACTSTSTPGADGYRRGTSDAAMAGPLCDHLGIECRTVPVVLEGAPWPPTARARWW